MLGVHIERADITPEGISDIEHCASQNAFQRLNYRLSVSESIIFTRIGFSVGRNWNRYKCCSVVSVALYYDGPL